ncbi:MAG: hypothetical protein ABS939_17830 [Psychrobacillus sp.]
MICTAHVVAVIDFLDFMDDYDLRDYEDNDFKAFVSFSIDDDEHITDFEISIISVDRSR